MNTVTKIGKAALARVFHSNKWRVGSLKFSPDTFPFDTILSGPSQYYVWGIELGLRQLVIQEPRNFLSVLLHLAWGGQKDHTVLVPIPSHVIELKVHEAGTPAKKEIAVTVYRLTDGQERELKNHYHLA